MKLLKNVYYELEKAKIVGTFEEFSTEFLKKDRSTMSFLLNRKREMSLYAQINCLKEIHKHIELSLNLFLMYEVNQDTCL